MSNPQVEAYLIHNRKYPELRGVRLSEAYEPSNISAVGEVVPLIRQSDHIAEAGRMVELLRECYPVMTAHAGTSHMLEGFRPRRNKWDELIDRIDAALKVERE